MLVSRISSWHDDLATCVHTIGFMNQLAAALQPWFSDSMSTWLILGRMIVLKLDGPYPRSMGA